jgi:hypothetical protein
MIFRIDGAFTTLNPDAFYGGARHEPGIFEYLYHLADGRWFLHVVNVATLVEPTFRQIQEEEAIGWLIRSRRAEESYLDEPRSPQRIAPRSVVLREESFRYGSMQFACPPPIGQHVVIELPRLSATWDAIVRRQAQYLEPGRVLEHLLWPQAAAVLLTVGFRDERHDPLVTRLQAILESRLLERPRLSILQSLQDRGCDLLIEWPLRAKYGVQLKSNGDVEEKGFANKTLAQIGDSRQHGLERLFLVLAADITNSPNAQKVRGIVSRISSMNDPYIVTVPPERAWTLLVPEGKETGSD